jgi:hypothetical protein
MQRPVHSFGLRWAALGVALGFSLLLSCGGGGGGGSTATPSALLPPANFTATQGAVFDDVDFRWTPAGGGITGYEAEGRLGSGAWESLGTPIPADAIGGSITFDPSVPELTSFTFHIRSVRGTERSAWSPDAAYLRSLRPPEALTVGPDANPEAFALAWGRRSTANTGTRVERALRDANGVPGPYVLAADLPAGATAYVDPAVAESASYQYRVRHTAGSVTGMEAISTSPVSALRIPTEVRIQSGAGSVSLQWTNRSLVATGIAVLRVDGGTAPTPPPTVIAQLSPTTSSYLDAGLGAGTYTYTLELRSPSQSRQTPGYTGLSLPASGWTASQILLPSYVRNQGRDGRWYGWENGHGTGQTTLYRSAGSDWEAHALPLGAWAVLEPGTLVDRLGHPHAAYAWRDPALLSGPMELRHVWHDGTAWREEAAASRVLNFSASRDPRFALAGDGTPHLFWSSYDTGGQGILEYAVKEGGTWVIQTITSPTWTTLNAVGLTAFQVAEEGTAYLALGLPSTNVATGQLFLQRRPPGGSWSEEPVPAPGVQPGPGDPLVLLPTGAFQVDLLYNVWDLGDSATPWHVTTLRKSGTWGLPVTVFQLSTSGGQLRLTAALDPAGMRMAVPQWPTTLHLLDPALGGWRSLAFPATYGFGPIWFDPAGHLHVLTLQTYSYGNPLPYAHFTDAP